LFPRCDDSAEVADVEHVLLDLYAT
jgi:hypothetical protein